MQKIRTLVVEDEPMARDRVKALLLQQPGLRLGLPEELDQDRDLDGARRRRHLVGIEADRLARRHRKRNAQGGQALVTASFHTSI